MLGELRKYFDENFVCEELKEKPKVALFLAKREMYRVEICGISFVVVRIREAEDFGIVALKKQRNVYMEQLQCNVAYCFDVISKSQRDSLIKSKIPFICLPGQVYLPFLGVVLSENFKKAKNVKTTKMMPATQSLFLYLLYQKENYVLKSVAAEELGFTRTSITRASEQLLAMGLIKQEKVGKEMRMSKKGTSQELLEAARQYMINPIQKKMVVRACDIAVRFLNAGETALSEYSMLNVPKLKTVAVYKDLVDEATIEEIDARWEEKQNLLQIEFWKYDPFLFANFGKVDQVSLACSMADCEDERVEMAIEEMLEEIEW